MNQTTALAYKKFDHGDEYWVTEYVSECGCRWVVDQWGNVRSVCVCIPCVKRGYPWEDQLSLLPEREWPANAQIQTQPDTQC